MHLTELKLKSFRALKNHSIDFPRRVSIIVGKNGQGKTSFLEAVYLLANTKSFRASSPKELINWGDGDGFSINGKFMTKDGVKNVEYEHLNSKRRVSLNGNLITDAREFVGQFPVLEFSPADHELVSGSPAGRRKFIDRLSCMLSSSAIEPLFRYQGALKNRNAILSKNRGVAREISELLKPWDILLVENGALIAERRRDDLEKLNHLLDRYYSILAQDKTVNGANEQVKLRYRSEFINGDSSTISVESLLERLRAKHSDDCRNGTTGFGVHRDEIVVLLDSGSGPRDARKGASQGQCKTVALALKLSALELVREGSNEQPILLLDDVESELDRYRRLALFRLISDMDSQILLTSTELSPILEEHFSEYELFEIQNGEIVSRADN